MTDSPDSTCISATEPIPLVDLVRLPSLLLPRLSWQRDRIAFYWDRTGRNELYVQTIGRDDARQVSHGEVPRSVRIGPIWDRSGSTLVFPKDAAGDETYDLYRIELATGEVAQLTSLKSDILPSEFSPDNRWILYVANAAGRGGKAQLNAWRVPASGGGSEQLTDFDTPIGFSGAVRYNPTGSSIAFSGNESSDLKNADIYVCGAAGEDPHRVFRATEGSRDSVSDWHPDGRHLALDSDATGSTRPLIVDVDTGVARAYGLGQGDEYAGEFSLDGRMLLTMRLNGVRIGPGVYDVADGAQLPWATPDGLCRPIGFSADGKGVFCVHTNSLRRPEFSLVRRVGPPTVIQKAAYGALDPKSFVGSVTVRYPTFDGREIEALMYTPPRSTDGVRRPAIVEVHGGPTAQFLDGFNPLAQYLASRGFVVLQPNIRGSTGYGPDFRDLNRYDWGGGDLEDVVQGVNFLAGLPDVDSHRIGIWGGSYGGFMTYLAAVRKPELWKAACAWVGVSDLERLYDESREHYRYYFREQMGDPDSHRALWRERSAIHSAERLKARLLMVHGTNDPRCPIDQARLFRDRLVEIGRKEGIDFDYVELTEEGHGSSDIEQKLRSYRIVSDFFARAL